MGRRMGRRSPEGGLGKARKKKRQEMEEGQEQKEGEGRIICHFRQGSGKKKEVEERW